MPIPIIYPFPIKRPAFIEQAVWLGSDDDLSLELRYRDTSNQIQSIALSTTNPTTQGKICLPNTADITWLTRDTLISHLRMATMISQAIPGAKEWTDAFILGQIVQNMQTAIGTVKVVSLEEIDQQLLDVTLQKATGGGASVVIRTDYNELGTYSFAPITQLLCVAGAIEKQFSNYVHDYPGTVLSAQQKSDIESYVLTLWQWI